VGDVRIAGLMLFEHNNKNVYHFASESYTRTLVLLPSVDHITFASEHITDAWRHLS